MANEHVRTLFIYLAICASSAPWRLLEFFIGYHVPESVLFSSPAEP
jgi:hypothetical protein